MLSVKRLRQKRPLLLLPLQNPYRLSCRWKAAWLRPALLRHLRPRSRRPSRKPRLCRENSRLRPPLGPLLLPRLLRNPCKVSYLWKVALLLRRRFSPPHP